MHREREASIRVESNGAKTSQSIVTMIIHALIMTMDEQRRIISDDAIAWNNVHATPVDEERLYARAGLPDRVR